MTRRTVAVLVALPTFLGLAFVPVLAHEGHEHTVMGTVSMIHDTHLEVEGTDGKASTFMLDDKTKILRGTTARKMSDIKSGDRVVVTAEETEDKSGKSMMIVKEVRLGASDAAAEGHEGH